MASLLADHGARIAALEAAVKPAPGPNPEDVAFLRAARAKHGDTALSEPFLARTLFTDAKRAGEHFGRLCDHVVDGVVMRRAGELDNTNLWMMEPARNLGDLGFP